MIALNQVKIISNLVPQINTPDTNLFNYRKPSDSQEASNIQVLTRTKEYMEAMFDIIMPPLKHANSNRLKSALFLLKIIVGMLLNGDRGNCIVKQTTFGSMMMRFGYSKDLGERQIRRLLDYLKQLGLITFERSGGYRSVYEYNATQMAMDIYFFFILKNKSYIKIECPDVPQSVVDNILARKKCPVKTEKMSGQNLEKNHYESTTCKKNVRSNNIYIKYISSPSLLNKTIKTKEPDDPPNGERSIPDPTMNETQEKIFTKVCEELKLNKNRILIFKEEVNKNLEDYLGEGRTLADFSDRLMVFYNRIAEMMYWS